MPSVVFAFAFEENMPLVMPSVVFAFAFEENMPLGLKGLQLY